MSRIAIAASWFKQTFAWSNSAHSWIERIVNTAFLLSAAGLLIFSSSIGFWQTIVLAILLVVAATVLQRLGWLKMFGPVLFYDMLCTARRGRYSLIRCFYSMLLLL